MKMTKIERTVLGVAMPRSIGNKLVLEPVDHMFLPYLVPVNKTNKSRRGVQIRTDLP